MRVERLSGKPAGVHIFCESLRQQADILQSLLPGQKYTGLSCSRTWALLISSRRNISSYIHNYSPSEDPGRAAGTPDRQDGCFSICLHVKKMLRGLTFHVVLPKDPPPPLLSLNPGIFKYFMVQSQSWGRRLRHGTITVVSRAPPVEPCWLPKYHDSHTDRPGKTEGCWRGSFFFHAESSLCLRTHKERHTVSSKRLQHLVVTLVLPRDPLKVRSCDF